MQNVKHWLESQQKNWIFFYHKHKVIQKTEEQFKKKLHFLFL